MAKKNQSPPPETSEDKTYRGLSIARYQEYVAALIQNEMEFDRQLLLLAGLGIGLLTQYLDELNNLTRVCVWLVALGGFLFTIVMVLWIFYTNQSTLRKELVEIGEEAYSSPDGESSNRNGELPKRWLTSVEVLDLLVKIFFAIGAIFTTIFIIMQLPLA